MTVMHGVVVDCANPELVSGFWHQVFGWEYRRRSETWHSLRNPAGGPHLGFQAVPEGKVVKNRVHLDIRPSERSMEAERERLESLGATALRLVDDDPSDVHYIMADPEGNEFCLLSPHLGEVD